MAEKGQSQYHYTPTESVCAIFVALFALSTILHIGQALKYKLWWMLPTAGLCGILEILGWSCRLASSFDPTGKIPFTIQITSTILGPTPLLAANFVILEKIILRLGPSYSRLSPKWYLIVFCVFDNISLSIQGVGGGWASSASTLKGANMGGNIMLGGIVFQLFTISVYVICAAEYFYRFFHDLPVRAKASSSEGSRHLLDGRMKFQLVGMIFCTIFLFIRAVYRTIELTDGWTGRIIATQIYFNVLEGAMVTLALFTLNFAHPGFLLRPAKPATDFGYTTNEPAIYRPRSEDTLYGAPGGEKLSPKVTPASGRYYA